MAARNRPRNGQVKDDADEERNIWNLLRSDAKKGDQLLATWSELNKRITELAKEQENILIAGGIPAPKADDELEKLIRESIPVVVQLQALVEGDSDSQSLSIIKALELLAALRASSESDTATRGAVAPGDRKPQRNLKRKHEPTSASSAGSGGQFSTAAEDRDSVAADSPGGPSPKVTAPRRIGQASSRSGSVPAIREVSVKTEDGDGADGMRLAVPSDRNRLQIGVEVFYRNKAKAAEGEGILCSITNIVGEGKQRRYEIRDSDPDPPTPPLPYRASVNHLVPIPPANASLPDLPPRRQVLALYPGTTTFYKAEVVAPKVRKPSASGGDSGASGEGGTGSRNGRGELRDGFVRLRFEGEEEAEREMDVERRYVVSEGGR